jgi:hypothetical protein
MDDNLRLAINQRFISSTPLLREPCPQRRDSGYSAALAPGAALPTPETALQSKLQ